MTKLTDRQQEVLNVLISRQKQYGFPPTNQELATTLGCRSVNTIAGHLRALERKGVITINRGIARGIRINAASTDSEAVELLQALLAGEENARLRAIFYLRERGIRV
ncbi:LexA family protein [Citrobacter freundii]